jgi:hypothetical protein
MIPIFEPLSPAHLQDKKGGLGNRQEVMKMMFGLQHPFAFIHRARFASRQIR